MKLPDIPDLDLMRQVKTTFPLLTVCRSETPVTVEEFSIDRYRETVRWDVDYILGPLEIGNANLVADVLLVVARIITLTLRDAGHRAYATQTTDGFSYPKNVLGPGDDCCNFSSSRVVDYRLAQASFSADGPRYHSCGVTLETTELSRLDESGFPSSGSYRGAGITLRTGTEQGLKTIVTADTSVPV